MESWSGVSIWKHGDGTNRQSWGRNDACTSLRCNQILPVLALVLLMVYCISCLSKQYLQIPALHTQVQPPVWSGTLTNSRHKPWVNCLLFIHSSAKVWGTSSEAATTPVNQLLTAVFSSTSLELAVTSSPISFLWSPIPLSELIFPR